MHKNSKHFIAILLNNSGQTGQKFCIFFYTEKVENVKSKEIKYLQPHCTVWVLAYVTIVVTTCHTIPDMTLR